MLKDRSASFISGRGLRAIFVCFQELTCSLQKHLQRERETATPVVVHGIDLDETLVQRARERSKDDPGITFERLDIMDDDAEESLRSYLASAGRTKFDVAFCFSVSMWIHLNHGDSGLALFLGRLSGLCRRLVLEPQPWRCYQTAARRMRKLGEPEFEHMNDIKFRKEELEPFILRTCSESGLVLKQTFGTTSWKRKLLLFEHPDEFK